MDCKTRLAIYFRENSVPFRVMTHSTAYTAQEVAAAQGIPGKQVAKVVMVVADNTLSMLVLPASYRIDFSNLRDALGAKDARLAHESEFENVFPDCQVGAMPPFGNLYGVAVWVDRTLAEDDEIVFQAGSHWDTIKIAYADYARLAQPSVANFALPLHAESPELVPPGTGTYDDAEAL